MLVCWFAGLLLVQQSAGWVQGSYNACCRITELPVHSYCSNHTPSSTTYIC